MRIRLDVYDIFLLLVTVGYLIFIGICFVYGLGEIIK